MSAASIATYIWGQCTAFVAGAIDWVQPGWGDASQWPGRAAAQGYPEGHTPHVGDVAAWAPGYAGAHSAGHVAQVIGVDPGKSITVAEENWTNGPGVPDTRSVDWGTAGGLTFIRNKGQNPNDPAGNGGSTDQGFLGIPGAINGLTTGITNSVTGAVHAGEVGTVNVGLYVGFGMLALVLIFAALFIMGMSTNVGRSAAKGAMLVR